MVRGGKPAKSPVKRAGMRGYAREQYPPLARTQAALEGGGGRNGENGMAEARECDHNRSQHITNSHIKGMRPAKTTTFPVPLPAVGEALSCNTSQVSPKQPNVLHGSLTAPINMLYRPGEQPFWVWRVGGAQHSHSA
jgi:hypothetical protein